MRWRSEGDLSSNFRATTAMKVPECDSYGAVGRMGRERERARGRERLDERGDDDDAMDDK